MSKFYKLSGGRKIYLLLLSVFVLACVNSSYAALSGNYTLNPAAPASATNYLTLNAFATDLYAGTRADGGTVNGPGVSAAVTLKLASGLTLVEQVEFRAATGASATNKITIKGSLSTVDYTGTVTTSRHTIWLNGAKFYTFDSLNVRALSPTFAWGMRFSNDASNNTIINCSVLCTAITTGVGTSTTAGPNAAICFTASTSILDYTANSASSSASNGSNNVISRCVIGGTATTLGPTYGIYEMQTNTTGNNSFINNTIQHFYQEGLAAHTCDGITITGNDFHRLGNTTIPGVTLKAINLYNNVRCANNPITVTNNLFHDISTTSTLHGFYHLNSTAMTSYNGGAKVTTVTGNKTYNLQTTASVLYGIYVYQVKNSGGYTLANNEVYKCFSASSTFYGLYTYNCDKLTANANIIRNNKGATFYGIYDGSSTTNSFFTNNAVYKNVATSNEYGLYLAGSGTTWSGNVYANNTIAFDSIGWSTTGTCYGIYINGGSVTGIAKVNNVFNNMVFMGHKGSSAAVIRYGIYNIWGYNGYLEERNNVHFDSTNITPSTTYYGSDYQGPLVNLATLAAWSAFGYSDKDLNFNPYFIKSNYFDYRISNVQLNNMGNNVNLPKDAVGTNRTTGAPDIGAFETIFNLKAETVNPISSGICAGFSDSIKVTIRNNATFTTRNISVGVTLNGVLYASDVIPVLAPATSRTLTFKTKLTFTKTGTNTVKYFIMRGDAGMTSDDTITKVITVESPGGGVITLKPGSKGFFNHPLGYDVTAFDESITYRMTSPKKYTDIDFGSKWTVTTWATDAGGATLPGTPYTFTHPSNTEMTFKPSSTYVDQFITLNTQVKDLVTGCDTIFKRKIFIAPKGVISYNVPASVCFLTDIDFVNNSSISSGDLTYTWDFGDGSDPYNGKFAKHNYAAAGLYTVTLSTISVPFGYIKDTSFVVDVREIPRTNFNKTNACEGNTITLTNTTMVNKAPPATYVWDFGDGSPTSTNVNVNRVYANPGVYKVTLTASKGGCSQSISKNVYQFARPTADFVKVSGECLNSALTFANNSTQDIGNYFSFWNFDDGGVTSTDANPVYTYKTAGVKNVKLVITSEFGCKDSVIKAITVRPAPTTDFTFPPACDATPTTFNNTTNLNGQLLLSYTWDFGDGTTSPATNPVKNWTSAGSKTVKLKTLIQNGCSSEVSKTVDVGLQPDVDFNLTNACSGTPVNFENLTNYNPSKINYKWSFGDGNFSSDNSPNYTYTTPISQTYTVKLKGSIVSGCSDSVSKTITITPLPATCTFNINGNVNSATKTNYAFVPAGGSTNGTTYTWVTGDGNTLTSTAGGVNYTYDGPGIYCIKMIARNVGGCECEATKCITLTTDINSAESMNNALSVYPNPTNGLFNVKFEAGISSVMTVNVFNSVGMLIKTVTVDGNNTNIDLSEFAAGVYVVKVTADNYTATQKITLTR